MKWGKIGWRLVDECVQCDVCGEGWDTRLMRDGDAVMRVERSIGISLPQRGRVLSAIHAHPLHWRDGGMCQWAEGNLSTHKRPIQAEGAKAEH